MIVWVHFFWFTSVTYITNLVFSQWSLGAVLPGATSFTCCLTYCYHFLYHLQVSDKYKLVSLCPLLKMLDGKVSSNLLLRKDCLCYLSD